MLAMKKQVPPHNTETTALKPSMKKEKDSMIYYKAIFIYMLGGLVGTLWETILNLCRGRGFVFCNGSILTPFNFVYGVGALVIIACQSDEMVGSLLNRCSWRRGCRISVEFS